MKVYVLIISLIMSSFQLFAGDTKNYSKESLVKALTKRYSDLQSLSASIHNAETGVAGVITAAKGNKYHLKAGDRVIISDGETIWNYSKKEKKVIINNASAFTTKFSLDDIFFTFISDFQVESFRKVEFGYAIELIQKEMKFDVVDKLFLWIDGKSLDIFKIQIQSAYNIQTWEVVNLKINPKIKKDMFRLKVPKGVEIIDLR